MYKSTRLILAENRCLVAVGLAAYVVLWNVLLGSGPMDGMSRGVVVWWTALCAVSLLNLCGWRHAAAALERRKANVEPAMYRLQRRQLLLSAVYVLGCGFRSILPRADVQRLGLVDSWVSSVMVGRSVATLAELCFMIQWALLLHACARDTGAKSALVISWLLVPLIVVAEVCSWYGVLTTCYLGNAIEESIWALCALLLVVSCLALWSKGPVDGRPFLAAALVLGVAYLIFMGTVDIPMYVSRWLADEAQGREYLSLGQGLRDILALRSVTFSWEAWRAEMPWMSLYFSVAVWCSIALVHVPRFAPKRL
jgi:hypothetical protein